MKRVCGFYVSNIHFVTMILPFINEKLKEDVVIETFFENDLKKNINNILSNLIVKDEEKKNILKINWENTKIKKYSYIENKLKKEINKNKENIILIGGKKKYIYEINNLLNKFLQKNNDKNISIINCFHMMEFEDNIKSILDTNEYILNTSGIHRIDEVFDDYKKNRYAQAQIASQSHKTM